MKSGRGVKHYHAHTGMPGYLPNQTAAFGTLEEARAWADALHPWISEKSCIGLFQMRRAP